MNPQQFSFYLSQNSETVPGVHGASSSHVGVPSSHTSTRSGKQVAKDPPKLQGIGKKTTVQNPANPLSRVKKQLEDHNTEPTHVDLTSQMGLIQVQMANLQRIADTSLRRIHDNEIREQNIIQGLKQQYELLKEGMTKNNGEVRSAIETLAKYSLKARTDIKTHNSVIDDFQSLLDHYTNNTFEHYLNERCLKKFNEMADKLLKETELSSDDIKEITKSLGMDSVDTSESEMAPLEPDSLPQSDATELEPSSAQSLEGDLLYWNFDEVINLLQGNDGSGQDSTN